jgi:hypothetical protein
MIRSDREYRMNAATLRGFRARLEQDRAHLADSGHSSAAIAIATAQQQQVIEDLADKLALYDRLTKGGLDAVPDFPFEDQGKLLVALRLAAHCQHSDVGDILALSAEEVSLFEYHNYDALDDAQREQLEQELRERAQARSPKHERK